MLVDGLTLTDTSEISNPIVASGTAFPAGSTGELFYRTDLDSLYVFNGTIWNPAANGIGFADLNIKPACVVGTTANISLGGLQTIDGYAVVAGDRVLVKNQSVGSQNGIYVVSSGSWTRSDDFDGTPAVLPGDFIFVTGGTTQGDTGWVLTTDGVIQIGVTALTFAQFTGANAVPGGANNSVQFNNNGAFGGAGGLYWFDTNKQLYLSSTTPSIYIEGTASASIGLKGPSSAIQSYASGTSNVNGESLTVRAGTSYNNGNLPGTMAGGNLTLTGGDINVLYSTSGLLTGGNVIISGGIVSTTGNGVKSGGYVAVTTGPSTSLIERLRILNTGAWSVGSTGDAYGTSGQVLTSNGNAPPTWSAAPGFNGGTVFGATSFVSAAPQITLGVAGSIAGQITGPNATGTMPGTSITISGGASNIASIGGGSVSILGGNNTVGAGNGGASGSGSVTIQGGNGNHGDIIIAGGAPNGGGGQPGSVSIQSGPAGNGAAGGTLTIAAGDGTNNASGLLTIRGGNSTAGGGNVQISGGVSSGGTGGNIIYSTGTTALTERLRFLPTGAWSVGSTGTAYGTAGQVLTSNGNAAPTWANPPTAPASTLTGTTLATNVVNSSLTSVGVLVGLNVSPGATATAITINSGSSSTTNASNISLTGGATTAAGFSGGTINIYAGNGTSGAGSSSNGGAVNVVGGYGIGTYAGGGSVTIAGGQSSATGGGAAGDIFISPGIATGSTGAGGNLYLRAGYNASGGTAVGGAVYISTGNASPIERLRILANGAWSVGTGGAAYGASGQVLTSNGNAAPTWTAPSTAITLTTAAQPNVTSVGTLTSLAVAGAVSATGTITTSGGSFDITSGAGLAQLNNFRSGDLEIVNRNGGGLKIYTGNTSLAATINAAGNVGLGAAPAAWWSSLKAIDFVDATSLSLAASTYSGNMTVNAKQTSASGWVRGGAAWACSYYNQFAGAHNWANAAAGAAGSAITWNPVMTLDANGNLVVGAASAQAKVSIDGVGGAGQSLYVGGWGYALGAAATWRTDITIPTGNADIMYFSYKGTTAGSITLTNSGTNTAYVTSSDYRLKTGIAPMVGALAKVMALKPCTYTWNANGSAGQGFIAHELQAIVPDCVMGEKDAVETKTVEISPAVPATFDAGGVELTPAVAAVTEVQTLPKYQGIDTSFLVATLTAAIQEQQVIIDAQRVLIDSLIARVTAIEAKLP